MSSIAKNENAFNPSKNSNDFFILLKKMFLSIDIEKEEDKYNKFNDKEVATLIESEKKLPINTDEYQKQIIEEEQQQAKKLNSTNIKVNSKASKIISNKRKISKPKDRELGD